MYGDRYSQFYDSRILTSKAAYCFRITTNIILSLLWIKLLRILLLLNWHNLAVSSGQSSLSRSSWHKLFYSSWQLKQLFLSVQPSYIQSSLVKKESRYARFTHPSFVASAHKLLPRSNLRTCYIFILYIQCAYRDSQFYY